MTSARKAASHECKTTSSSCPSPDPGLTQGPETQLSTTRYDRKPEESSWKMSLHLGKEKRREH